MGIEAHEELQKQRRPITEALKKEHLGNYIDSLSKLKGLNSLTIENGSISFDKLTEAMSELAYLKQVKICVDHLKLTKLHNYTRLSK